MDFRKMQCFIALSEEKHFSRAADKLYMAQSSFSAQIAAAEKELGATLVKREHHTVEFTPEGEAFLRFCGRCFSAYQDLRTEIQPRVQKKHVVIGLFYSSRMDRWADIIARENARPDAPYFYEISMLYKNEKIAAMLRREIPISFFLRTELLEKNGFHFHHVFDDAIHVVLHPTNPLCRKSIIGKDDCKDAKFLVINSQRSQAELEAIHFLQETFKVPKSQFIVKDSLEDIYFSMKNGQYLCLLPKDVMPAELVARPLDWPGQPVMEYGWVYERKTPEIQWILDNIK